MKHDTGDSSSTPPGETGKPSNITPLGRTPHDRTRHALRGAMRHRQNHRQRAHDEAHDEVHKVEQSEGQDGIPTDQAAAAIRSAKTSTSSSSAATKSSKTSDAPLITDNAGLAECVGRLSAAKTFAFDTEFIGELTYRPQLCLIQVATSSHVELIDPMASRLDLAPFWALLSDPSIVKVVHAGEQDLQHVWRFSGKAPANVFDTQIAAGFVSLGASTSLARLTQEITGKHIAKGFTLTDWSRRPLSSAQLRYAMEDVRYLCEVHRVLSERLSSSSHAAWLDEECALRCAAARVDLSPELAYQRVRGSASLDGRTAMVLRQIAAWRETAASASDLPPRSLIRDEVLVDIARRAPNTADRLLAVRGMPRPVVEHHADELIHAIQLGRNTTPPPQDENQTEEEIGPFEKFGQESIWAVAQCICAARSVDPQLVTSKKDLQEFLTRFTRGLSNHDAPILQGWRKELLGNPLLSWMAEKSGLSVMWRNGRVVPGNQ